MDFHCFLGLANILIGCEYLTRGSLQIYLPQADKRSVIIRPNRIISRFGGPSCVLICLFQECWLLFLMRLP